MTFATFVNGETILHDDFVLLEDNYISVNGNEPTPIEDYGDYLLTESNVNKDEAFQLWLKAQESSTIFTVQ